MSSGNKLMRRSYPSRMRPFDLIVCQFGVMYFPNKQANPYACLLPEEPTYSRCETTTAPWPTRHFGSRRLRSLSCLGAIRTLCLTPATTMSPPFARIWLKRDSIDRVVRPAKAASARHAAVIAVQGSLLRTAIEPVDPSRLGGATDAVEHVMRSRFGDRPVVGEN